ncbi:MAG: Glu/Leu/Phe/Val dehydrogenase dimerization domain-containing protein, partial [Alphaproteobacteria bacterium]|nr:Glu/Leu/Phe/Val dehydrogenase dimerization domain-containing protein [Alphaproteobacteria bacterium]
MSVFSAKSFRNHEQVLFHQDPASGLVAIIAIHDTTLGPALGGCRFWAYEDEDAAL